ncbi:NUDIX domain-containing protein [Hypericibacter sp.]|uniref:NUDIX domain-containing protein n=1 Tax=Hypericibacter sp. TaxID=2705401 RepID=UPI003D6D0DE3
MNKDDVEILERQPAYRGYARIDRYRLRHRLHNGGWSGPIDREVYDRGHVTGVLPYDPDRDCVVMIEQFRVGAYLAGMEPWQTETVAGIIDKGESPEQVARREAKEEADLEIRDLVPMLRYAVSPGAITETVALFAGRVDSSRAGGVHGLPAEGEDIKVLVVPVSELAGMIEDGRIGNGLTIIAVQWLLLYRDKLRASWKTTA